MPKISLARGLVEKLNTSQDINATLEDLLFEIPDEAMAEFIELADPVEVDVSDLVYSLIHQMSEAFGMTPLGLTVLMSKIFDRTMKIRNRFDEMCRNIGMTT